ncbi:MAG: ISAs1 family transposase, partial [Oscillospiraceae bacterium]|nr:ISAs1 family transposase [Oscillospiraceae bacterium]
EWHYYISSKNLTAEELLKRARLEWSVETMHWLLDVHLGEDGYKVRDKNIQLNSNIIRKHVINSIKTRLDNLGVKRPISRLLFDNLLDPTNIIPFLNPK